MKKAIEITSIVLIENIATVTYITGTVRKYSLEKLPKTVQTWMESHPAEEPVEEARPLLLLPMVIAPAPLMVVAAMTDEVEVEAEALPVEVEMTEVEVVEEVEVDEAEAPKADRLAEAIRAGKALAMMVARAAKAVAGATRVVAPVVARVLVILASLLANGLVDGYYAATTYLPIWGRRVALHTAWFIQDAIPAVRAGLVATGKAIKAAGLAIAKAAMMVAGWAMVATLTTISLSIRTAKTMAEGWRFREELIHENVA